MFLADVSSTLCLKDLLSSWNCCKRHKSVGFKQQCPYVSVQDITGTRCALAHFWHSSMKTRMRAVAPWGSHRAGDLFNKYKLRIQHTVFFNCCMKLNHSLSTESNYMFLSPSVLYFLSFVNYMVVTTGSFSRYYYQCSLDGVAAIITQHNVLTLWS